MRKVTDPALLAALGSPVSDPELLAQLNAPSGVLSAAQAAQAAAEDMSWGEQALAGIGGGMLNAGTNIGNMLGLVPDEDVTSQSEAYGALGDTTAGMLGQLGGEVLATAPLGVGAGSLVGRVLPGAARAAGLGNAARNAAMMATEGATEGAILAGPDNRGSGAILGGGMGGLFSGAGALGGKIIRGARGTPEGRLLRDAGVDVTPGQFSGEKSLMGVMEESKGARELITPTRQNAVDDVFFNILEEGVPPGGGVNRSLGLNDALDDVYKQFGEAYDAVRGFPVSLDGSLTRGTGMLDDEIMSLVARAPGLDDAARQRTGSWLENLMTRTNIARGKGRMRNQWNDPTLVDSGDLLKLRSEVRDRIRNARRSASPNFDEMDLLKSVEQRMTKTLEDIPAQARDLLKATDAQYGQYKTAEEILARAGDASLTPAQISAGVKATAPSRGNYARGGGRSRDLSRASKSALPFSSGKTGYSAALPSLLGGAGALAGYLTEDPTTALVGGAAGAAIPSILTAALSTTRAGRRAYRGQNVGQRVLQRTLDAYAPAGNYLNPAARAAAIAEGWRED